MYMRGLEAVLNDPSLSKRMKGLETDLASKIFTEKSVLKTLTQMSALIRRAPSSMLPFYLERIEVIRISLNPLSSQRIEDQKILDDLYLSLIRKWWTMNDVLYESSGNRFDLKTEGSSPLNILARKAWDRFGVRLQFSPHNLSNYNAEGYFVSNDLRVGKDFINIHRSTARLLRADAGYRHEIRHALFKHLEKINHIHPLRIRMESADQQTPMTASRDSWGLTVYDLDLTLEELSTFKLGIRLNLMNLDSRENFRSNALARRGIFASAEELRIIASDVSGILRQIIYDFRHPGPNKPILTVSSSGHQLWFSLKWRKIRLSGHLPNIKGVNPANLLFKRLIWIETQASRLQVVAENIVIKGLKLSGNPNFVNHQGFDRAARNFIKFRMSPFQSER